MSVRSRLGARVAAATVVTAVPIALGSMTPAIEATAQTSASPRSASDVPAILRTAPLTPSAAVLQRHYLARVAPNLRPQTVAKQTTIAGGLALSTKQQRHRTISVSSTKGRHTWTASSLAEHDLPSAAMRAYKHATRSIEASDPGCHLPWTLLAGIGRVESDHGRYGGSVLGADGVPRPAIVGIALDGKGPVAAIRDTDHGQFDGDTVWDRAVGPMQFIPSTWSGAGRDGDGDGKRSPNDIDDAALAAAGYLCHGGRNLADPGNARAAIFGYNPSDYYVALVSAFAHGYRTGSFVIPSPPVARGAGDGVVHLRADHSAAHAKAKPKARKHITAAVRRAPRVKARAEAPRRVAHHHHSTPKPTPTPKPKPKPTPKPTPAPKPAPKPAPPPKLKTARGPVAEAGGAWTIGGVRVTVADMSGIARRDYDGDGTEEPIGDELDGLAAASKPATLSYYDQPSFKVNGFSA